MALHEQSIGATDEWYTPPHVFRALALSFDLDVASPGAAVVPWIPALRHITQDSLAEDWRGFVWMNPPFGGRNGLLPWLKKWAEHRNGVALVPDRTSAPWWQTYAYRAELLLFVSPKLKFIRGADRPGMDDLFGDAADETVGEPGTSPAQGTTLLAIGARGCEALRRAASSGLGFLAEPVG